ncbi:MAG TPA: hypothetical protein P5048_04960 [Chlamydiales bacterium]|nr:hypothetical protein [Chlamydiales bacterium]
MNKNKNVKFLIFLNILLIFTVFFAAFKSGKSSQTVDKLEIKDPNSKSEIILQIDKGEPQVIMKDKNGIARVILNGSEVPIISMHDRQGKMMGIWKVMENGMSIIGLAKEDGSVGSLLKGGSNPSSSFFSSKGEASTVLGMIEDSPYLLVSGKEENEGIMITGGNQNGMLVLDENGRVKVFISKHGVLQQKEQPAAPEKKEKEKFYTYNPEAQKD